MVLSPNSHKDGRAKDSDIVVPAAYGMARKQKLAQHGVAV